MNDEITLPVDELFRHLAATVVGFKTARGFDEGWAAPVGVFDATCGFGEQAWIDAASVTILSTRLRGAPVTWCCGKYAGRVSGPSSTVLQPKGTPNHSRASGAVFFSQIYLPDTLIDRVANAIRPGGAASGRLRDDLVFPTDYNLDRHIRGYLDASVSGTCALELEAKAILLVGHLLRAHHGFGDPKLSRGCLSPWQLRRAIDAIEAHLGENIGLDMLASVAGCSPTHFSRAFKQSTGMAPFQWLLERRIERAKDMLAEANVPLVDVALAVGFSAQPQFTTAFKRATGVTPGAWRRERLS